MSNNKMLKLEITVTKNVILDDLTLYIERERERNPEDPI